MATATISFRPPNPAAANPLVRETALSDITAYYSALQIQTAGTEKTICMLHERCMFHLYKQQMANSDRKKHLVKAQNILAQLQAALIINDHVSKSLYYLYDYCYVLIEKDGQKNLEHARQIINVLSNTFRTLFRNR